VRQVGFLYTNVSMLEISTPGQDMKAFSSTSQFVFPSFPFILLTVNILTNLQLKVTFWFWKREMFNTD